MPATAVPERTRDAERRRGARRRAGALAVSTVLGVSALVWSLAHLFTGHSLWARAIAWGDSDVGDHRRFPLRVVENAAPRFDFAAPTVAEIERYAPALRTVTTERNGRSVTEDLAVFLRRTQTVAFLIVKDDVLLYEAYLYGHDRESTVTSFSVAKSFVSALVGIAIAERHIGSVEDAITAYVPELLERDARYADVTLRHLLSMSSGIRYRELGLPWGDDAATYYAPDLRAVAVSSPIEGEPGERFHYNNFHPLLLGLVLERATGRPVAQYLEETIWRPLGMEAPGSWSLDSERSGFEKMESGVNGRAIDFAKFGRLFLRGGDWDGVPVVPAEWVEASTRGVVDAGGALRPGVRYGYLWWVNPRGEGRDHVLAAGKHGQFVYVAPDQGVIIVRFGRADRYGAWVDLFESLVERLAGASP